MSFVPNRKLLQHDFDGYKLAPKHLGFTSRKLSSGVNVVHLKEQFSYQHVRAFSLHNNLFDDPWNHNVVYWCGNDAFMAAEVKISFRLTQCMLNAPIKVLPLLPSCGQTRGQARGLD